MTSDEIRTVWIPWLKARHAPADDVDFIEELVDANEADIAVSNLIYLIIEEDFAPSLSADLYDALKGAVGKLFLCFCCWFVIVVAW